MIKYIVTWIVINSYSVPCPVEPPFEDEYGRTRRPQIQLAVMCVQSDSTLKKKEFLSRLYAIEFINKGKADSVPVFTGFMWPSTNCSYLSTFKLDSVIIKTQ